MKEHKTKLDQDTTHPKNMDELLFNQNISSSDNNLSDAKTLKLIHELEAQLFELKKQNEDLLLAKNHAEIVAEKYTKLFDFAPSGYITLSKDGDIKQLNFRTADLLGKERSFFLDKNFALFISDETKPMFNSFLEKIFEGKSKESCELNLTFNSEEHVHALLTGIIDDNTDQCLISIIDISRRKKAEEKTKMSEEKYHNLFNSNKDSITIFRIKPDGTPENFIETNLATSELFGYSKKELLSLNVTDLEKISNEKRKKRLKTLKSDRRIIFETIIKNKKGNKRNVEVETFMINYLNEPAIMNITRDITEKKQLENNLKKANENLMSILDAIPDLLFEVGFDGMIHHYQSHRDDLLAVPPSVFMGKFFQDVLPPDVANICFNAIKEADEKGWSIGQQYSLNLNNKTHWFEISVSPINVNKHKDKNVILLARDITDRKIAEEKLRDEKERIKTILELVGNPIFLKDNEHKITYANSSFYNLFGLNEKNVIGKTLAEKVPENEKEHFLRVDRSVLDTGIPDIREEELTVKGQLHTIITSKTRFEDESGNKMLLGSIYDITKRKNAEVELQKSQDTIKGIFNVANSGIMLTDSNGNFLEFNNCLLEMLGYTAKELKKLSNLHVTHPDDLEKCRMWSQKIINGEINRYQIEKRYLRKDKSEFWGELSVSKIKDDQNKTISTVGIVTDITERKRAENALIESEEKYRGLVENSPDGIVIYIDDKIVFINDEGVRMLRAKNKEEILKKPVLQFIHPDSLERVIQRMQEVIVDDKASEIVEERFIDIDGIPFDVEIKAIPTVFENQNAVQVIVHNITERKRTQEKIKQLSQAVEQSPVAIVITNIAGIIEYVNPKFLETTGYSLKETIGQNPRILKSGHTSQEEYQHLWQTISSGHEWFGEFHNMKKDGTLYLESASISPILNSKGKPTHYIAIKEDITERKQVEQQLINAKEKAEESDRLKLAFLANMSHEIRTPMNGILGFTELLKDPTLESNIQQDYIKIIEKSGIRMLNIINDIISISKIESGQLEITLSETNINNQIEYLYTFFKPEATLKGIELITAELLPPNKAVINTDREKIYAILTNFIKNAIKFTNSGTIEFGCKIKGKHLEFFVKDTGLGISNSQKKIIFERFRQANDTISHSIEGSGLGLAISKAYVEKLGGKIWVESEEGKGSTFCFTIPFNAKLEQENKIIHKKASLKDKEENKIKDLKVLIVEDDSISKLLITIAVKPFSKEIIKVSTGFEAIEACRSNPDIDLVMMDINMPKMGGYEATKKIREFNKKVVIIAQTANGLQSDRDEAIAAGCTDYISKPIKIEFLSKLIHTYFK